jgi:hypothetical protein
MRRTPGAIDSPAGDQVVILDASGTELFTLNEVGTVLWNTLGDGTDGASEDEVVRAAVAKIQATFDGASPGQIEADVREFLTELRAAGLVTD